MLVYGDVERREDVTAVKVEVSAAIARLAAMPQGLAAHAVLANIFLRTSQLVQGLVDAEFAECGEDGASHETEAGMDLLAEVARRLSRSWFSGFRIGVDARNLCRHLEQLPD